MLDQIAGSRAPAEQVLHDWGRAHRYAGSKDRRAIADRVYRCLRNRVRLVWAGGGEGGRTLVLFSLALTDGLPLAEIEPLYSGAGYGPEPLTPGERARLSSVGGEPPEWVRAGLPAFAAADFQRRFGDDWAAEAEALMTPRAPIDLRVNALKGSLEEAAEALGAENLQPEPTPYSAWGLRLPAEPPPNVQALPAFRDGRVEIQDEGSQLAAWLARAAPGETVVDYCAGGGGKTLALRQDQRGEGTLVACDVDPKRVAAVRPRLERAGLAADLRVLGPDGTGVEDLEGAADLVFVDAPCSGSGTWRRRPETAWKLDEAAVERFHDTQVTVLRRAARLVRPGGRLVYVTCSVLGRENEDSAATFAAEHSDFTPARVATAVDTPDLTDAGRARLAELAGDGHTLQLTPRRTGTDGFFIALFERSA
ncbi:MAG TPA: RsmB/NOP family class I SAM-dependent RNA methyltransferase [Caulobacteraceae bacterium]